MELLLGAQIRQQEIAARRAVAKNPVKMDAIKREVAMAKAQQVRHMADYFACPAPAFCLCLACSAAGAGSPVSCLRLLLRMHQHDAAHKLCVCCLMGLHVAELARPSASGTGVVMRC